MKGRASDADEDPLMPGRGRSVGWLSMIAEVSAVGSDLCRHAASAPILTRLWAHTPCPHPRPSHTVGHLIRTATGLDVIVENDPSALSIIWAL